MKLKPSKIIILLISLTLLAFVFRGCGWYGASISGRVVEEGTKKPVADAYVIVRWQSRVMAGFAGGETACYHVEVVNTDKKGDYTTPVWWSPGWHSPFGHSTAVNVYQAGYEESDLMYDKIHSYRQNIYYLKPFKGTKGEQLRYLLEMIGVVSCGTKENRRENIEFYKSIYWEAKTYVRSKKDKSILKKMRYRFASIWSDTDAGLTYKEAEEIFEMKLRERFR